MSSPDMSWALALEPTPSLPGTERQQQLWDRSMKEEARSLSS